jgi:predicted transcriptional regulator
MMTRSATTTGSPLSKNIRHVGSSTAEIVNRIKELEDANRALRSQNRKQDALMNKYKERWERLKEGAKKRQPSNSTTTLLSSLASNSPPITIDSSLRK